MVLGILFTITFANSIKFNPPKTLHSICPSQPSLDENTIILSSQKETKFSNKIVYGCQQTFLSQRIQLSNCILSIYNSNFVNSNSDQNAIYFKSNSIPTQLSGNIEIKSCHFSKYYSANGGSIYIFSSDSRIITISNCYFNSNTTMQSEKGGAIYINAPSVIIEYTRFQNCYSKKGGSIYYTNEDSTQVSNSNFALQLRKCSFKNSQAQTYGGCLYIAPKNGLSNEVIEIKQCTFTSSTTKEGKGAGIYINSNKAKYQFNLIECLFGRCKSSSNGGAVYFNAASGSIKGCLFVNNYAEDGEDITIERSENENNGQKLTITTNTFIKSSKLMNKRNSLRSLIFASFDSQSQIEFTDNKIKVDKSHDNFLLFNFPEGTSPTKDQLKISNNDIPPSVENRFEEEKSQIKLLETDPQCPEIPSENGKPFFEIKADSSIPFMTNIYACNVEFPERISIDDAILHIFHCKFSNIKDSNQGSISVFVSDSCESTMPIKIENCEFFKCENVAIMIQSMQKEAIAEIKECTIEQCRDSTGEYSAVYISANYKASANINIQKSKFLNNYPQGINSALPARDLYFSSTLDSKLTITDCTFDQKNPEQTRESCLIFMDSSIELDFERNKITIHDKLTDVKLFSDDVDTTKLTIKENKLTAPSNDFVNVPGLSDDAFTEEEKECPEPPDGFVYKCDNIYSENEEGPSIESNTFIGIFYCTFYSLTNANTNKGGAIYISTSYYEDNIQESICIYNSDFYNCYADHGAAIYLESSDYTQLFDILECTFTSNSHNFYLEGDAANTKDYKGGAIYIRSSTASFKISKSSFNSNEANEGAAIFYVSENFDSQENQQEGNNNFDLNIIDCKFVSNYATNHGGAIYITIKNGDKCKPIDINNCVFTSNKAAEKDDGNEEPEYGGAIYYSYESSSTLKSKSLLEGESNYIFRVIDCTMNDNQAYYRGGAIYLSITNGQPSKTIEINHCHFKKNFVINTDEESVDKLGYGSDIFYFFDSPSSRELLNNNPSLLIYQCDFTEGKAVSDGGSIMISIENGEPAQSIEINNCTFAYNEANNGGAIYYKYGSTKSSFSSSKYIKEEGDNNFALHVYDCIFDHNLVYSNGAAIVISIEKGEPTKPIEINYCQFKDNTATDLDAGEENGGAIYYSFSSPSTVLPSKKLLAQNNYALHIIKCEFNKNLISYHGGAIYLTITNSEPNSPIEIDQCTFNENIASSNNDESGNSYGAGGDIYFIFDVSTPMGFSYLNIINSVFTNGDAQYEGGSINIYLKNGEPSGLIEINGCTFGQYGKECEIGGVINYIFGSTSSTSKNLLEDVINKNNYAFYITQCKFNNNQAAQNGGCISLSMKNGQPYRSIVISSCSFVGSSSSKGGSIYYNFDSESGSDYPNSPSLNIDQCNFSTTEPSSREPENENGAAIYISITKGEPTRTIKIDGCNFESLKATNGGSIYYNFASIKAMQPLDNTYALQVASCHFKTNSAEKGADIYLSITNGEPSNPIEINECEFNKAEKVGSIYYNFESTPSNSASSKSLRIYKCTFIGQSSTDTNENDFGSCIYFSILNNGPSKSIEIDDCKFESNKARNGPAICYNFGSISNPSKTLLELTEDNNNDYALYVFGCSFDYNEAYDNGGAIAISINDGEPTKPIEIYNCMFTYNKATEKMENIDQPEYGGAIYYSFVNHISSFSKKLLAESNYAFRIYNSTFESNEANNYGGSIYMQLKEEMPTKPIEINHCSFVSSLTSESTGYDVCFTYETPSSNPSSFSKKILEATTVLKMLDCNFSAKGTSDFDGFLYLLINNVDSKVCEISGCSFDCTETTTNIDAVSLVSNRKSVHFHFVDCDFISQAILFNALSAQIEKCRFTNIKKDKSAIYYKVDTQETPSETNQLKIDFCNFSQSIETQTLIFFDSELSTKFVFLNNNITLGETIEETRVLGCKSTFNVNVNDWEFKDNYIFPEDGKFIKTKEASEIPADCEMGFLCKLPLSSSEEESSSVEESSSEIESSSQEQPPVEESSSSQEQPPVEESSSSEEEPSSIESSSIELPPGLNCDLTIENSRCDINGSLYDGQTLVQINFTSFHDLGTINNDYGAAIHLINVGLDCNDTSFTNCKAIGGGAIYVYIDNQQRDVLLNLVQMTECQAKFGGGVYIFSNLEGNKINITSSTFIKNQADKKPSTKGDILYGGSAVFMQVVRGDIFDCKFTRNIGSGVKFYNDFEQSPGGKRSLKENEYDYNHHSSVSIKSCLFEVDKQSSSSIFYVRGQRIEIPVDVIDCIFDGNLGEDSYFIDGESNENKENNAKILNIKSCKFSSDLEKAINLKKSPILFDSSENEFMKQNVVVHGVEKKEEKHAINIYLIVSFCASVAACVVVLVIVLLLRKKNVLEEEENSDNIDEIIELNKNELILI